MKEHLDKSNQNKSFILYFLSVDIFCLSLSWVLAFLFQNNLLANISTIPLLVLGQVAFIASHKNYRSPWRFYSFHNFINLTQSLALGSLCLIGINFIKDDYLLSFQSIFVGTLCSIFSLTAARVTRRHLFEKTIKKIKSNKNLRIAILGINSETISYANYVQKTHTHAEIIGFIDSSTKENTHIGIIPNLGSEKKLSDLIKSYAINEIIIPHKELSHRNLQNVLQICRSLRVSIKILNHADESLRNFKLEDLLERNPIHVDNESISSLVQNKVVLVTGAGGSIGSELCRQLLRFSPEKLILIDHSEYNLYAISQELDPLGEKQETVIPILLDLKDEKNTEAVFEKHKPSVVYHAAAYKHVHLVNASPNSAILNNVQPMIKLMSLCDQYKTERFVLISSDKAVNPGGIMGATKKLCEKIVSQNVQISKNHWSIVRFGNVLGSSGSLIPLLKNQIRNGGPITITHPEMTRYFMLCEEAVSLVLQASSLSSPGDLHILNMGSPIKILDIAKKLILLLGKTESEIPTIFTGIRSGEKLHEELYLSGSEIKTSHPDIWVLPHQNNDLNLHDFFHQDIEKLITKAARGDSDTSEFLYELLHSHDQTLSSRKIAA